MNFFDQVLEKYAPTYTAILDATRARQNEGALASPIDQPATMATPDTANPYNQFGAAPQPSAQPQPAAPIQHDDGPNPYAQWEKPEAPQGHAQAASQSRASQVAPVAQVAQEAPKAFDSSMVAEGPNTSTMPTADGHKLEQLRADVAMILNNNGSKADIAKRLAQDGLDLSSVPDLDKELTYREAHKGTVLPVGLAATPDAPKVEYHGADKGQGDAFLHGAYDGITLGAGDEIDGGLSAVRGAVENTLGYGDGKTMSQTYDETVARDRQDLSDAEHYNPWTTFGGQVVGNLALAPLAPEAGAARGALAIGGRAAAEGAVMGGAYGFNSATGGITDRLAEGAKGAAGGAIVGGTLGAIGGRIAANRAVPNEGREVLNAADRLNANATAGQEIKPLAGHVGTSVAPLLHATLEPTFVGGSFSGLAKATRNFEENSGHALSRIADDAAGGTHTDLTTAAAAANDSTSAGSLAGYDATSRQASNALYDNASNLAGNAHLQTPATVQAIDRKLAEWRQVPNGVAGSQALQDLRDQLAGNQWTVAGLRRLRTSFGDTIDSNNRTVKEAATALWPTLSKDIDSGLRAQGNAPAASAYRAADRNYAQRVANLDVISKVIGKDGDLSADAVSSRISSMAKSDYDKLGRAMAAIEPSHAAAIRGGLIDNMGKAVASRQNAAGDAFSLGSFASRWSSLSDQAKSALYSSQTISDLNDLATLAAAGKKVGSLGNSSRSGVFSENYRQFAKLGEVLSNAGGGTVAVLTNPAALSALLLPFGAGKLLATAGFARALVRGSESQSIEVLTRRLSEVARRNPAMLQNIIGFRDAVVSGKVPDHALTVQQPSTSDPSQGAADLPAIDDSGPNPYAQFAQTN